MVMVRERAMITSARIAALDRLEDGTRRPGADAYGWISALRSPAIRTLMADDGPLQLSLFDEQDHAEITSPEFPGERLIACRNPVLAAVRARKREELLAATEKLLAPLIARVQAVSRRRRPVCVEVGKVISTYKTGKHFAVIFIDASLTVTASRTRSRRSRPGRLLRAPHLVTADELDAPRWWPPTRTSNTSSGISGTSDPTTWTCGPCSTGWRTRPAHG